MKINIDSFLTKGEGHYLCQDYIMIGYYPFPNVVLSDGCSDCKFSEIGSKILTSLTVKHLLRKESLLHDLDIDNFMSQIIYEANMITDNLGLPATSLAATLSFTYEIDGRVYGYLFGDGWVIHKKKDEEVVNYAGIRFKNNTPYYPLYAMDNFDAAGIEGSLIRSTGEEIPVLNGACYSFEYNLSDLEYILISSDGIESFGLSIDDIVKEITNFKTLNGKFLKKRIGNKLIPELSKIGLVNFDDISIGGFTVKEEK